MKSCGVCSKSQFLFIVPISNSIYFIIKCSEKCAPCDWSERVHYISIKHARYVTRVHCRDIMHSAYVISTSVRNSRKTTCSSYIVELYKHLGFSKSPRSISLRLMLLWHFSRDLKKIPRAYITQQCIRRVFYFFTIISSISRTKRFSFLSETGCLSY